MHFRLRTDAWEGWAYVHPAIDDIDLASLAGFCSLLNAKCPKLPYGLRFGTSSFDDSGRFVAGPNETGLTCATFVIAIFEWAGVPLIDISTWQARAEDEQAQRALVEVLRGSRDATPEHIVAVEREIGCIRVRPEEVAASSTLPERPLNFADAARIGAEVLAEFRALGL